MKKTDFMRLVVQDINDTKADLIHDAHLAKTEDMSLIVNNMGYCFNYQQLEEMVSAAKTIIRTVEAIKSTYDTGEYNRLAESINQKMRAWVEERDAERFEQSKLKLAEVKSSTMIYLMINRHTGHYKIGRSRTPKARERTLQSQEPAVELITTYPGTYEDEKALHELFGEKRIRGEWFALDAFDLTAICRYFNN